MRLRFLLTILSIMQLIFKERLLRLEERYRDMENESKTHRSPRLINETNHQRYETDSDSIN